MPKISVIVPIYNVEKYLRRCVDSILAQTFTNFELILVDDGSPDDCGKICDEYAEKDIRIHVIHKENGGLSSARNAGLDIASGDYIVFVDSDDYIESDLFQTGFDLLKNDESALLVYGFVSETENEIVVSENPVKTQGVIKIKSNKEKGKLIINELTDYRIPWSVWTKFFNRKIIEDNHLRFEDNNKIFAEDIFFCLCYFPFVDHIICEDKLMYHYLLRSDSIMSINEKSNNIGRFEELTKAVQHFYLKSNKARFMKKYFPLIYYKIISLAISKRLMVSNDDLFYHSKSIIESGIRDKRFLKNNIKKAWQMRRLLYNKYLPNHYHEERISYLLYCSNNRMISYRVRNIIIHFKYFKS